MPLSTTVIGSFPKPAYLETPDWFRTSHSGSFTEQYNRYLKRLSEFDRESTIRKASKEIIDIQTNAGVDVLLMERFAGNPTFFTSVERFMV